LVNKKGKLKNVLIDVEKQDWEIREVMEHTTGVSRTTSMKQLKRMAEEIVYGDVDNNTKVIPLYFGWLEALSWMKENIVDEMGGK
tara:strand:- start:119 stop:373 length:255 start_codon:yes stop_codon:yes gene_type:complete